MYSTKTVYQSEIDAFRDEVRAKHAGKPFKINSNGLGVHVRCTLCGGATTKWTDEFLHEHLDECPANKESA